MIQGFASQGEINQRVNHKSFQFWESRFEFLNATKGIRPKNLCGLLGTTGAGKTSLLQSIIVDTAKETPVLVFLSEECVSDYEDGILLQTRDRAVLDNIKFFHEASIDTELIQSVDEYINLLKMAAKDAGAAIIFLDNLSTSLFYSDSLTPAEQNLAATKLFRFCETTGITLFYACHTTATARDGMGKLFTPEDVRGCKQIAIRSSFFYIIQRLDAGDERYNILRIYKHRGFPGKAGFYSLKWEGSRYVRDAKISYSILNEMFKRRNQL